MENTRDTEKVVIEVYADSALKRRVEVAAAKHNVPVAAYLLEAIEEKLADEGAKDDEAEADLPAKRVAVTNDPTLFDDMRDLRDRILARRGGKPLDIDILELVRSERDEELTGLP